MVTFGCSTHKIGAAGGSEAASQRQFSPATCLPAGTSLSAPQKVRKSLILKVVPTKLTYAALPWMAFLLYATQKRRAFLYLMPCPKCKQVGNLLVISFCCVCAGLHPSRLQVPACLDSASSGGRWTQHTALNQIQSSNGGWIETLEPNGAVSRMAPPVPDFLGPFRKEAPSVQGGHRCMLFRMLFFRNLSYLNGEYLA